MTTGGWVFDGVGVLSRTTSEAGADSRPDRERLGCVCNNRAGGKYSVSDGMSSEGSFGDDLSTTVNGVSGIGDGEDEWAS